VGISIRRPKRMTKKSLVHDIDTLPPDRKAMLNRLKRVEGQLRGIQRMIIEGEQCQPILVQLSAARKAMQQACVEVVKGYMKRCIEEGSSAPEEEMEKLVRALVDMAPPPSEEAP
jgi:DNA-binding FrmR family transcriptional regulator